MGNLRLHKTHLISPERELRRATSHNFGKHDVTHYSRISIAVEARGSHHAICLQQLKSYFCHWGCRAKWPYHQTSYHYIWQIHVAVLSCNPNIKILDIPRTSLVKRIILSLWWYKPSVPEENYQHCINVAEQMVETIILLHSWFNIQQGTFLCISDDTFQIYSCVVASVW